MSTDVLALAGRIALGHAERLAGSAQVTDANGDATVVMARVDGPTGIRIRIAVVHPTAANQWRAAGRTVELDASGALQLSEVAVTALATGRRDVADYRARLRAAHASGLPESDWPDSEADIAAGVIRGARWGELRWTLTREAGDDYVNNRGVNLGPGGSWTLALDPAPDGADESRGTFDANTAATITDIARAISNLVPVQP